MTKPRYTLADLPDWPRRMRADVAAAYLGIGVSKFQQDVDAGLYPPGIVDGGVVVWDRKVLDGCVDRQAAGQKTPREKKSMGEVLRDARQTEAR